MTSFASENGPQTPALMAEAAVHGYTTAFWFSAAIFAIGAVVTALLLESGAVRTKPTSQPALAH